MQNPAFNPMQPEDHHLYDDASPITGGFARFGAPAPLAGEGGASDAISAAQDGMLNEALAIGHAPSIAAALGLIARMRGMGDPRGVSIQAFNPVHPASCHLYVVKSASCAS